MAADMFTIEGLENQILQSILGNGPLAGFAPFIKKFFNENVLGSNTDAILDAVLYTNMTPTGVFMEQQSAMQRRMASKQLAELQTASRTQWFEAAAKTMMSYDAWAQAAGNEGKTIEDYNAFMRNRAAGMADNQAINFLLNMIGFDPDGINEARTYLGKAGANLVRHRRSAGDMGAFTASRAVRNIFTDTDGNLTYDKRDYGFMNLGETASVIAALTRDIDYFNTPEVQAAGSNVAKIKAATENIKKAAQEYTQALSPLKDLFGSDIPAMIQSLEQVTGRRFTQMSAEQVSSATRRIMAGADAGRYTLKQLTTVENQVESAIYGMNVPIINDISALAQAQTILGITNTGLVPSSMSAHRYEQLAADRVMRTSNSRGATAVNQAYALWRERKDKEAQAKFGTVEATAYTNDVEAFADFQKELRALGNVSTDQALLQLSGATNIYSLQDAAGSRYYQSAVEQNLGGVVAMERSTEQRIQAARWTAFQNGKGTAFDEAVKVLQEEGGLALLNNEEELARSGLSSEAQWQVRAIRNGQYGDLAAVMSAYQTSKDVAESTQRNQDLRMSIEGLGTTFAENPTELIGRFMGVRREGRGGIPTMESIKDILSETVTMQKASDNVKTLAATTLHAASWLSTMGARATDPAKQEAYIKDFVEYASKDGLYNAHYLDAINEYAKALDAGKAGVTDEETNRAAQARALTNIEIARYGNEDLLNRLEEAGGMDRLYEELKSGMDVTEVNDYIKGEMFYNKIATAYNKLPEITSERQFGVRQALAEGTLQQKIKELTTEYGDVTSTQIVDLLKNDEIGQQLIADLGEDRIKTWANGEASKSSSPTTTSADLFGMFQQLINKFDWLGDKMDELISKEKHSGQDAGNSNLKEKETEG